MIILAEQNLVFKGPRDPAYFEQSSTIIWWFLLVAVLLTILLIMIIYKKLLKRQKSKLKAINKARDLHSWEELIHYYEEASSQNPCQLDLIIALLKQGSYLAVHNCVKQSELDTWLNLTPQELTHALQKKTKTKTIFDVKLYLQKLNYLEHIRFNPKFNHLPQRELLQTTLNECLILLKQAKEVNNPSLEENAH